MPRYRNRLAALSAVLALVLHGFWPALAQANPADASPFGTICTADGAVSAPAQPGDGLPAGGAKHQKHCPLCAGGDRVQALAWAPVILFQAPAPIAETIAAQPAPQLRSTSVLPASPRAPPVQS
jgi:hypothetical protein